MPTKRTGREENRSDAYPLNDKPRKPFSNTVPKGAKVDLRALGSVGVRLATNAPSARSMDTVTKSGN